MWTKYTEPQLLDHAELLEECERLLLMKHPKKDYARLQVLTAAVRTGYSFKGNKVGRTRVLLESLVYDKFGRELFYSFPCGHVITCRERSDRPGTCGYCRTSEQANKEAQRKKIEAERRVEDWFNVTVRGAQQLSVEYGTTRPLLFDYDITKDNAKADELLRLAEEYTVESIATHRFDKMTNRNIIRLIEALRLEITVAHSPSTKYGVSAAVLRAVIATSIYHIAGSYAQKVLSGIVCRPAVKRAHDSPTRLTSEYNPHIKERRQRHV